MRRTKTYYRCKNCGRITHEGERRRNFSSGITYHMVVEMKYLGLSESMTSKLVECGEIEELKED